MKKILAERGLQINLSDLYSIMQEDMGSNFTSFVKSVILEPGLRIAEGDEFLVRKEGSYLKVKSGGVVFADYDIFVPSSTASDLSISLDGVSGINEPGVEYAIYIKLFTNVSHPYPKINSSEAFMTVRRNIVKAILVNASASPGANAYLLAVATVALDGSLVIEDRRMGSLLKLVSKYASHNWESEAIPSKVEDVEAQFISLENYKISSVEGFPVDSSTSLINRRIGPAIQVTWPFPSATELDALNGVVYYKAVAIPSVNGIQLTEGSVEQIVVIDRIGVSEISIGRVGCMIHCDLGAYYSVFVYRISDVLDMKVSEPSNAVIVRAGAEVALAVEMIEVSLAYAYNSSDFINISTSVEASRDFVIRVFAYESVAGSGPEYISRLEYLLYEGPPRDVLYRVRDKVTNDTLTVTVEVIDKFSALLRTTTEEMAFSNMLSQTEEVVAFTIPESLTGWPGREAPLPFATRDFTSDGTNAIIAVTSGHNRLESDYIYITNTSNAAALANGVYRVSGVSSLTIILDSPTGTGTGTCDIAGNADITAVTNPAILKIDAGSHLQDLFSNGNKVIVSNTSAAGTLPDGTYVVESVDTANEIHLTDNTGPAGTGYCDVTAPEEIDLYTFSLSYDAILSRMVISCYDGQNMYTGGGRKGGPEAIFTTSTSVGDFSIAVNNGGGNKAFDATSIIPAGSTITLKLNRYSLVKPIDASAHRMFIYFKKSM